MKQDAENFYYLSKYINQNQQSEKLKTENIKSCRGHSWLCFRKSVPPYLMKNVQGNRIKEVLNDYSEHRALPRQDCAFIGRSSRKGQASWLDRTNGLQRSLGSLQNNPKWELVVTQTH